jgi:signal transduction histidine kinase
MTDPERVMLRRAAVRLGIQAALLVSAIVLLLTGVAVLVLVQNQHTAADGLLNNAIARADGDVTDTPPGLWLVVERPSGRSATPHLPRGLPYGPALASTTRTGATRLDDVHVGAVEYRVLTKRHDGTVFQAALDLRTDHEDRLVLVKAFLLSGVLALGLAALAGAWFGHRAVQPLAAAAALQRRFIADASHELRTPLTLLSTRAQLLRRRTAETDRADLDRLVEDARNLGVILDDLLLAADPRGDVPLEPVDLAAVARQVAAAAATGGPEVIIDAPSPRWVRGTDGALRRATNALVDNAVRHARSRVTVSVTTDRRYAVLGVADDGPGIDDAIAARMFERFASTEPPGGGHRRYGLGLALVAEIAHRLGGTVTAGNLPDSGAAVRLRLPLADDTDRELKGNSKNPPPG